MNDHETHAGRNIVVLFDGTGNRPKLGKSTNVVEMVDLVDTSDPERQIVFYLPGVGTQSSDKAYTRFGEKASRYWGLLTGKGLRKNVGIAYEFLMKNYRPGDSIHIFGFSRGAFTACALTGMLHHLGLLRPEHDELVSEALWRYWWPKLEDATERDWADAETFAGRFGRVDFPPKSVVGDRAHAVHVYLWDNVKAMGILRRDVSLPYSSRLTSADTVSHALAIDERRRPFAPKIVSHPGAEQVWFSGVHSDVGGFFRDEERSEPCLGDVTLDWMVEKAAANGLEFEPGSVEELRAYAERGAAGRVHPASWRMAPLTARNHREIPADAKVHTSAASRFPDHPVDAQVVVDVTEASVS